MQGSYHAANATSLFSAVHSTDRVETEAWSGASASYIDLGFDDWITGLAAPTEDRLLVMPRGPWDEARPPQLHDVADGRIVRTYDGLTDLENAACGALPEFTMRRADWSPPAYRDGCDATTALLSLDEDVELHVIGIYEPSSSGRVVVYVDRPGPVELVLSSYEAVRWEVRTSWKTQLRRVLVNAHHESTVDLTSPDGVQVEEVDFEYAYDWPSSDGAKLVLAAERHLGRKATGFVGCYDDAQTFHVQ